MSFANNYREVRNERRNDGRRVVGVGVVKYLLKTRQDRIDASSAVLRATEGQTVEIRDPKRTEEQSALLHVYLGDIAKQLEWFGKKRSVEDWKCLCVSGHRVAIGGASDVCPGIESEVVQFRKSTTQMGVKELSELIDYVIVFAIDRGVKLSAAPRYSDD